jgi:YNFM family putative membrane transporter
MIAGSAVTLARPLALVIVGIALMTIGVFGAQSVVSSWVAVRARRGRAQGTSLYLCFYYLGSSLAGWAGGYFWAGAGWSGVVAFVTALLGAALWIAWRIAPED